MWRNFKTGTIMGKKKSYLVVQKETGAAGSSFEKKRSFLVSFFVGSLLSIIIRDGRQNGRWVTWNSVNKAVKLC